MNYDTNSLKRSRISVDSLKFSCIPSWKFSLSFESISTIHHWKELVVPELISWIEQCYFVFCILEKHSISKDIQLRCFLNIIRYHWNQVLRDRASLGDHAPKNVLCLVSLKENSSVNVNYDYSEDLMDNSRDFSVDRHGWGYVDVLLRSSFFELVCLNIFPACEIPLHFHNIMEEHEMILSKRMKDRPVSFFVQSSPAEYGSIRSWMKGMPHYYQNKHDVDIFKILCLDLPCFIPEDEILVPPSRRNLENLTTLSNPVDTEISLLTLWLQSFEHEIVFECSNGETLESVSICKEVLIDIDLSQVSGLILIDLFSKKILEISVEAFQSISPSDNSLERLVLDSVQGRRNETVVLVNTGCSKKKSLVQIVSNFLIDIGLNQYEWIDLDNYPPNEMDLSSHLWKSGLQKILNAYATKTRLDSLERFSSG